MYRRDHVHGQMVPDLVGLPELHVQWVYYHSYYDGPQSGMVRTPEGERLWAEVADECSDLETEDRAHLCGWYRRFRVIRLTPAALAEEDRRHGLFVEHVGDHWVFDDSGNIRAGTVKPEAEHSRFYDQAASWPEWKPEGSTVGWFDY